MLLIELLSERFKNEFKFRWPFSNSTLEIEWVRKGQTLYLRPKDSSPELLWMCSIDQGNGPHDSFSSVSTLAMALKRKKVWRCCLFQDQSIFINRQEGIIASPTNKIFHSNYTYFPSNSYFLGAAFQLPLIHFPNFQKPQKYLLAPPLLVEIALTNLQSNETSDFNKAKQWLLDYEDGWSIIDWDKTTKLKVLALLSALYWLYASDAREYSHGLSLFGMAQNNSVVVRPYSFYLKAPQKLFDAINQYFELHLVNRRRVYTVKAWDKPSNSFPELHFDSPTAHEKIEALFLWREFLTNKLPQDEIEAILPSW